MLVFGILGLALRLASAASLPFNISTRSLGPLRSILPIHLDSSVSTPSKRSRYWMGSISPSKVIFNGVTKSMGEAQIPPFFCILDAIMHYIHDRYEPHTSIIRLLLNNQIEIPLL
jgi:hypothetical protein